MQCSAAGRLFHQILSMRQAPCQSVLSPSSSIPQSRIIWDRSSFFLLVRACGLAQHFRFTFNIQYIINDLKCKSGTLPISAQRSQIPITATSQNAAGFYRGGDKSGGFASMNKKERFRIRYLRFQTADPGPGRLPCRVCPIPRQFH